MKKLLSVIILAVTFLTSYTLKAQDQSITLTDIWASGEFFPESIDEIRSMNDGEHYSILAENSIVQYAYKTGKQVKVLLNGDDLKDMQGKKIEIEDYVFSADEKKILITTDVENIYRHSFTAMFYWYDIEKKALMPVSKNGNQSLAEFSPDGNHIAFIRENNIFIVNTTKGEESQITSDGKFNSIINGAPDWVYEEEFGFSKGFFWSPDGKKIAFYRFDESQVKEYTISYYNVEEYPEWYTYKYPKAGEPNSIVDVYVYQLDGKQSVKLDIGSENDQYIPRIGWTQDSGVLWIQRMNRLQNELELLLADPSTGKINLIYKESNKYYIDITDNLKFLKNGKQFIFTSEKDGYNHIYLFGIDGNQIIQITKGDWDVWSVVYVDELNQKVYYLSSENGPMNKMLFSIGFDGKNKTCLFSKPGTYDAEFSSNGKYFILTFSDANTPYQYAIYNSNLKKVVDLEDNEDLVGKMKAHQFVQKEFFTITTSENVELHAWMMKPAQMDENKKYPVLMHVYGGPGSQTVENAWGWYDFIWSQMLVQKGIIVVSVDNRGTGGRGEEFKKCTYMQLGKLETIDQIEAAKYLAQQPYIDGKKIAIFGWSYGGYMSSLCMTKGADVFSAGIAVAPVTNWRYYDNIYTERFMRTPQENPDGYDKNSPVFYAKKLKGPFLIVHGDADDNVHVQNTMELVSALVNANKQFEMAVYPNKNHGIYGGWTRYHLYYRMTSFLEKHLLGTE